MTTWSAARTNGYRINLEDMKGVWTAMVDRAGRLKADFEASRMEEWNQERLTMLQSRGGSSYK